MPEPISSSSANSSVYDPNACDPTNASCVEPPAPAKVQELTIPPVRIEAHVTRKPPSCERELNTAVTTCGMAAAGALATALTATTPVGPGVFLATFGSAVTCAKLISDYDSCKEVGASRAARANECEARGGVPLSGVDKNEIVCLEVR